MIDWHCHILPHMDDGSHDTDESTAMLQMQAAQGVDTVIATPHFYANDETVASFLERRNTAFRQLQAACPDGLPTIRLGAEVKYYQGISRLIDLQALCIEGSKLLLLEMPMASWTETMIRELEEMSARNSVRLVLAHIERYFHLQNRRVWQRLLESGILMQVNASFFHSFGSKRKALSLLRDGTIQFIGSDCHNTASRPPQIGKAFDVIQKKLGTDYVRQMNEYGDSMLAVIKE